MSEDARFIYCKHGVLWRVVNLYAPSRWRRGQFGEQTFICPCPRNESDPHKAGRPEVADAEIEFAPEHETTVGR